MKKKHLSRILSMTLAFALFVSSMDMTAYAAEVYQEEEFREALDENPDVESDVTVPKPDDDAEETAPKPDDGTEEGLPELDDDAEETAPEPDDGTEESLPELDDGAGETAPEPDHNTESETDLEEEPDSIDDTVCEENETVSENDLEDISNVKTVLQEAENIVASGSCGENVAWTLYDDGLIRISGTGRMDTDIVNIPWKSYTDVITRLEICDGVTSIGDYAFWNCKSLTGELMISDSVISFGNGSFSGCDSLSGVLIIPDSVEDIGYSCFSDCNSLTEVYISEKITVIESSTFSGCKKLCKIHIPEYVKFIGYYALYGIEDIYYEGSLLEWNAIEKRDYAISENALVHIDGCNIVRFESGEGSKISPQPAENGQLMVEPEKPVREGYEFTGWYTSPVDQTDETRWDFDTDIVSEDFTLYAGWSNLEVIVYLDANGGQLEETSSRQTADTGYTDLPSPTRHGYSFAGWCLYRDYGEIISAESKVLCSGSYTIYAQWTANSYHVKLNPAGGNVFLESITVKYESRYDYLPDPEKEGYEFLGWFTSETGGTHITSSSKVTLAEDHELFAHWKGRTYSVTFDARGGEVSSDPISVTNDMRYGELPVPVKDNCTFLGWYTEAENGSQINAEDKVYITSNITLYAHWQGDERTVYFDANGGEVNTTSLKVYYNVKYGVLPVPEREGHTFIGWFTGAESGEMITEESSVDLESDLTLYAHWKINEYTVVLHANGGSFAAADVVTHVVEHGNTMLQYQEPILYLYRIVKWTDASGREYSISDPVISDLELYAQWEKKYTVANPAANVKEGQVAAGTRVSLSTATNGAEIYYTLDGTVPTAESCLYDDAIVIEADTVIRAIAVKDDYNTSDNMSFTYTVENAADSWGDITDEDRAELRESDIVSADQVPDSFWVAGITDREYTGKDITFENIHVYYHKTLLQPGSDYTVKYANNINAAASTDKRAPSVTITGKGNYSDRLTKTFSIHKLSLGDGTVNDSRLNVLDITLADTGRIQKGTTDVTYDINGSFVLLKNGKDFAYSYSDTSYGAYKNVGEYLVTLTGKGNFTGTAVFKECISADKKLLGKLSFAKVADQAATGSAVEPDIVIKDGSCVLQKEKDYTLSYQNNVNVGTARMIVTGMGDYAGTRMVSFKICAMTMQRVTVSGIEAKEYTGSEVTQTGYTLTYKADNTAHDEVLSEGTDYTVSYINNIKAGKNKAKILFIGRGRFSGTLKVSYSIHTRCIQEADVTPSDLGTVAYQKKGTRPEIKVTVDDVVLKENRDYIVKYLNNTNVNDGKDSKNMPTVEVTGKGNYSGTVVRTFRIGPGSLKNATMTATDIVYRSRSGICKPNVKIVDGNGCRLTAGTDYSRTFAYTYNRDTRIKRVMDNMEEAVAQEGDPVGSGDIIPVGAEIKVTATGINKYAGSTLSTTFRYIVGDLSKADVKIPNQVFTGSHIELGKDQITVKVKGSVLENADYEIVGYSQNRDKGTATVVLRGIGNYSGTKRAVFKIVNRSMYYTVIFDANGGKGNMKKMLISADSASLTANRIKRAGAVFKGWNTRKDGLGTFYSDKQVVYSKNHLGNVLRLYAQWDIINYMITYNTDGGVNSERNPSEYNVTSNTLNLYAPTKEHFTFAGWYKDSRFRTKVTVIKPGSTGNLTLYAKWMPVKYDISFNGNGGGGYLEEMTGLSYGKAYTLRKNKYSRTGYSFTGWNTKADGSGTAYKNQASVMNLGEWEGQRIILYAMWDMDTYSISYVLDGGVNHSDNPASYTVMTDSIQLKEPERNYYSFGGWFRERGHKNRVNSIPKGSAGDLTLYAMWIPYQYEVIFDGNGNTGGSMAAKTYQYGTSYKLPANGFKKKNYRFTGWNTKIDGKGTKYESRATITNLVSENNSSITLYAQWKYVPPKTVNISSKTGSITVPKGYTINVSSNKYIYSYNLFKNGRLYSSNSWEKTDYVHNNFDLTGLSAGTYTIYVHECSYKMYADLVYSRDQGLHYVRYYKPTYENISTYTCKITVR